MMFFFVKQDRFSLVSPTLQAIHLHLSPPFFFFKKKKDVGDQIEY